MTAFYNEIDPYAAAWLRNLIAAGHIAPGIVDERPIQDIEPYELVGFTQCHFFAGIGVWSHALRRVGWSDDRPIWTGSCPCQPFSNAGQKKGFQDDRHLWPYWKNLIDECRPSVVIGEQVASALDWVDLVQADLEKSGYAFGANDLCAAGFGGAHIRQRIYFVGLADGDDTRSQGRGLRGDGTDQRIIGAPGLVGRMALPDEGQCGRLPNAEGRDSNRETAGRIEGDGSIKSGGPISGMADAECSGRQHEPCDKSARILPQQFVEGSGRQQFGPHSASSCGDGNAYAPNLGGRFVDWLYCRDGKWRPVGPGTFPLVDETPSRVGRLRAYGNALDAETATQFCGAVREIADEIGV